MKKCLLCLLMTFSAMYAEETTISSDSANYDGKSIILTGNVTLENPLGKVLAEKAILIRDEEGKTKLDFPWVEIYGKVRAALSNGSHLTCEEVDFDYTTLSSVFVGKPEIYYKDSHGEIYAPLAKVYYKEIDGHIRPAKIVLTGGVHLINAVALQYAIADKVEYTFEDQVMLLLSNGKDPVLFFDKQNDMQLSAQHVRAMRNEKGKESIQGTGDVRFTFKQDELQKLQERFNWE